MIEGIDIRITKLQLFLNDSPLATVQFCSIVDIPLDIQNLFKQFAEQVNNILENGYYGNEKLKDAINNGTFNGLERIYY